MSVVSVIVPAHDEGHVIGRCLAALSTAGSQLDLIVAANGCSDNTADVARSFPGVRVVEIGVASKTSAIRAAEEIAGCAVVAYVDADVEVTGEAILAVARELQRSGRHLGAPAAEIVLDDSPRIVRRFFQAWQRTPWAQDAPGGSGVYVLTEEGRARFGDFPTIVNDDQFVHDLFHAYERLRLSEHTSRVYAPRSVRSLIRRRVRTLAGQEELHAMIPDLPGPADSARTTTLLNKSTSSFVDLVVFVGVTAAARALRWRQRRLGGVHWERDDSSRVGQ